MVMTFNNNLYEYQEGLEKALIKRTNESPAYNFVEDKCHLGCRKTLWLDRKGVRKDGKFNVAYSRNRKYLLKPGFKSLRKFFLNSDLNIMERLLITSKKSSIEEMRVSFSFPIRTKEVELMFGGAGEAMSIGLYCCKNEKWMDIFSKLYSKLGGYIHIPKELRKKAFFNEGDFHKIKIIKHEILSGFSPKDIDRFISHVEDVLI